jgi:hypothetical protein
MILLVYLLQGFPVINVFRHYTRVSQSSPKHQDGCDYLQNYSEVKNEEGSKVFANILNNKYAEHEAWSID